MKGGDDDDDEITQLEMVEIVMRFRKLMSGIEQEEDLVVRLMLQKCLNLLSINNFE